jgi:microcystin-dependent protein
MKNLSLTLMILVLISISNEITEAKSPRLISYQGYISDNSVPVNGKKNLWFALYTAPTGGSPVWQDYFPNQEINNGVFSVVLGTGTHVKMLDEIPFDTQYWLEFAFDNQANIISRTQLFAVPYSFHSDLSDTATFALNAKRADTSNFALKNIYDSPIGSVTAFAGDAYNLRTKIEAKGWMMCDGRQLLISDYPELYDVIQDSYGQSNDAKYFYLPDYRGLFLRGINKGLNGNRTDSLADPDASSRFAIMDGANSGNKVGSVQMDAVQKHRHFEFDSQTTNGNGPVITQFPENTNKWVSATYSGTQNADNYQILASPSAPSQEPKLGATSLPVGSTNTESTRISSENHPKNIYVYWIIKVK